MQTRAAEFQAFVDTLLPLLCLLVTAVQGFQTVSLSVNYPHNCVGFCLNNHDNGGDIPSALGCDSPYANDCYCATNPAAVSSAQSLITNCVSSRCASGDLSDDLTAMESIYASYCIEAGYTQSGATNWYNPATLTKTSPAAAGSQTGLAPTTATQSTQVTQATTSQGNPSTSNGGDSGQGASPTPSQGLSTSDIIALGVGIPSGLCLFWGIGEWLGLWEWLKQILCGK